MSTGTYLVNSAGTGVMVSGVGTVSTVMPAMPQWEAHAKKQGAITAGRGTPLRSYFTTPKHGTYLAGGMTMDALYRLYGMRLRVEMLHPESAMS